MADKIKTEELEKVQGVVKSLREMESNFYKVSLQLQEMKQVRDQVFAQIQSGNQTLQTEMAALKEVYGDIVINLETGEYEAAPEAIEEPAGVVSE